MHPPAPPCESARGFIYYNLLSLCEGNTTKLKCVCSEEYCPPNHVNYTCKTHGNCFSQLKIDEVTNEEVKNYGCLPPEPSGKVAIFHCKRSEARELEERNSVSCCHERDFCNRQLKPTLKPTRKSNGNELSTYSLLLWNKRKLHSINTTFFFVVFFR